MGNKTLKDHLEELSKKDVSLFKINEAKRKLNKITGFDELTEGLTGFTKLQLLYIKTNLSDKSIMSSLMTYISYTFTLGAGILIEKKTDDFADAGAFLLVLAFWGFFMFMAVMLDKSIRNNFKHKLILDYFITLAIEKVDDSSNNNEENNNEENNNIETYLNNIIDLKNDMLMKSRKILDDRIYSDVKSKIKELVKFDTKDLYECLEKYPPYKLIDLEFVISHFHNFNIIKFKVFTYLPTVTLYVLGYAIQGKLGLSFSTTGWIIVGCIIIGLQTVFIKHIRLPKLNMDVNFLLLILKAVIKENEEKINQSINIKKLNVILSKKISKKHQ